MKRQVSIVFSILFLASMAFAHGNEKHVMGTVTAVSDNSITVETMDKHQVTVDVASRTSFTKGATTATLKDLKVGDRVVIHAVEKDEHLQAHTVRIGTATAPPNHHSPKRKNSIAREAKS